MEKNNVIELKNRDLNKDPLTTLLRNGAQKLIQQATKSELQVLLETVSDRRTTDGHAGVVRNDYLSER